MALEVQTSEELCIRVGNLALQRMGSSKTVTSLSQPTREAMTLSLHWDHQFRAILRQFPWPFATKYALLPLAPDGGSATAPVNGDWQFAFVYPGDCVFVRRVVEPASGLNGQDLFGTIVSTRGAAGMVGREFSAVPSGTGIRTSPVPFKIARLADILVVFCNQTVDLTVGSEGLCIEYTAIFDCPEELVDELFVDALAWRMVTVMAPSLSRLPQMSVRAWQMYLHTLDTATAVGSREQQNTAHGEAEWVRVRD